MKIKVISFLTVLFCLFVFLPSAFANPAAIILLRHGEKPPNDEGTELSEKGWERAKALPYFFHKRPEVKGFGLPVALFAMAPNKKDGSVRAIQTLKYVSEDLGLPINMDYTKKKGDKLAEAIAADRTLDGKLVVICWNHDYVDDVAEALGAKHVPKYSGEVFDRAWLLTYDADGSVSFEDLPQRLLPGDEKE